MLNLKGLNLNYFIPSTNDYFKASIQDVTIHNGIMLATLDTQIKDFNLKNLLIKINDE